MQIGPDLCERDHGVEGGLDGGLEELAGVVVEEEAARHHGGKHDDGPKDAPDGWTRDHPPHPGCIFIFTSLVQFN
jgi:hypothetical protein